MLKSTKFVVTTIALVLLSSCSPSEKSTTFQIAKGKAVMVGPTSSLFKVGIQRVDLHHAVCNFWDDDPGVFITYVDLAEPVTAKQLRDFRALEAEVDAMHDADKPIPGDGPSLFVEIVGQPDKGEDAKGRDRKSVV